LSMIYIEATGKNLIQILATNRNHRNTNLIAILGTELR
jgi:hypothetical protein